MLDTTHFGLYVTSNNLDSLDLYKIRFVCSDFLHLLTYFGRNLVHYLVDSRFKEIKQITMWDLLHKIKMCIK